MPIKIPAVYLRLDYICQNVNVYIFLFKFKLNFYRLKLQWTFMKDLV